MCISRLRHFSRPPRPVGGPCRPAARRRRPPAPTRATPAAAAPTARAWPPCRGGSRSPATPSAEERRVGAALAVVVCFLFAGRRPARAGRSATPAMGARVGSVLAAAEAAAAAAASPPPARSALCRAGSPRRVAGVVVPAVGGSAACLPRRLPPRGAGSSARGRRRGPRWTPPRLSGGAESR